MGIEGYSFDIDALRPETLSMARLSVYLGKLAELLGSKEHVHFDKVAPGSAQLKHWLDDDAAEQRVVRRIESVAQATAPKDVRKAFRELDELLVEDNASATYSDPAGRVIIPFPGKRREPPIAYPAVRQAGTLEGMIVSVGGKDRSAHVIIEDEGATSSGIKVTRAIARQLAPHLYGPKIRLFGEGRWVRSPEGSWSVEDFKIERFEVLERVGLSQVVQDLRQIVAEAGDRWAGYDEVVRLRDDDEAA